MRTGTLTVYVPDDTTTVVLPIAPLVSCGFPSPAEDYLEQSLDLNALLIRHKTSTFYGRVKGESMADANIHADDVLVIDRSLEAKSGDIVLCAVGGEFTVKRLVIEGSVVTLKAESKRHKSIEVKDGVEFSVWGVITYIIHKAV